MQLPSESRLKTNFLEKGILNAHKSDRLQILFVLILILDGNSGYVDIDVYKNIVVHVDLDLNLDLKTYFPRKVDFDYSSVRLQLISFHKIFREAAGIRFYPLYQKLCTRGLASLKL